MARLPVGRAAAWIVAAATALAVLSSIDAASAAAAGTIGHEGVAVNSATFGQPDPTPPKAEHRLWYAGNTWWGVQPSSRGAGYTIWRLQPSNAWADTGVVIDRRSRSGADALWSGKHLFVATHQYTPSYTKAIKAAASLLRFSFNGKTWVLDQGFPVQIAETSMSVLSIGQDSLGRILAAYVRNGHPWYTVTDAAVDSTFRVRFGPATKLTWKGTNPDPNTAATVTGDDIAAVNSSNGYTTIVWSNQSKNPRVNGFYAARHRDATAFGVANWAAFAVTPPGDHSADNHIGITAIPGDSRGRVFGVVKTSRNDLVPKIRSDPLLLFVTFTPDPANKLVGTWKTLRLTSVSQGGTRPVVVMDKSLGRARVFYAAPYSAAAITETHNQGVIFEKQIDYQRMATATGRGIVVQRDHTLDWLDDPTTTGQNTDVASGTVVRSYLHATGAGAGRFWHSGTPNFAAKPQTTPTRTGLALPTLRPTGSTAPIPTVSSRAQNFASTFWALISGVPGRYISGGTLGFFLLTILVLSARRRRDRRRQLHAWRMYDYYS
jgi:hypothetical protein